jgi:hypothetical protein
MVSGLIEIDFEMARFRNPVFAKNRVSGPETMSQHW